MSNTTEPEAEVLEGSHKVAPLLFFLNKPSTDYDKVTDNFDIRFDDDLEAILDGFVGLISVLLAEFGVPSQVEELDEDFFKEEKVQQLKEPKHNITIKAFN